MTLIVTTMLAQLPGHSDQFTMMSLPIWLLKVDSLDVNPSMLHLS